MRSVLKAENGGGLMQQVIQGEKASNEQVEWVKLGRGLQKKTLKTLNEDAKELATLGSSLLLVYTGALTLFKFPDKASTPELVIMALPIIAWLFTIYYIAKINFSELTSLNVYCPSEVKDFVENKITKKYDKLNKARHFFLISLGLSAFVLLLIGTPITEELAPRSIQFLVSDNSSPDYENASISVNASTGKTVPVQLIEITDKTYKVKLSKGNIVEFNKDMAKAIIYN